MSVPARKAPELGDFGLDEKLAAEIRAREERRRRVFSLVLGWGSVVIWACWAVGLHVLWLSGRGPRGLLAAAGLGLLAAAFAALPLSIVAAIASWALAPRHPDARALERYDAARAHVRPCDVCRLAMGDDTPKPDVFWCPRCGAWVCESCRGRYDLRAIAALKRRVGGPTPRGG